MNAYYTKLNLSVDDRADLVCELPSGSFIELGDIILTSLSEEDMEEIAGRWLGPKVSHVVKSDTGEKHGISLHIDHTGLYGELNGSLIHNGRLRWNGKSWFMSNCDITTERLRITYPNLVEIAEDLAEVRIRVDSILQCVINSISEEIFKEEV
jgi:hypothetical protein